MSRNEHNSQGQETQHYDVFLSYSRKDSAIAMLIKSAIQSLGYTVFYDQDILEGDPNWRATIAQNIDNCSALVFFRTPNSVTSKWCQREVNIADESEKTILPVAYRHDQKSLPEADEIKAALLALQTTYISDSPSVNDLKIELQQALEKSVGIPRNRESGLLLTDFVLSATENISSRYRALFEYTGSGKISADISDCRIALRWRLKLGDELADIGIALNKYSKRPQCYGNCLPEMKKKCPFYAEKEKKEYSIEASLDFLDKSRKSKIHDVLDALIGEAFLEKTGSSWCGNRQSIKYFFREAVLNEREVNEINDFNAVLLLIGEAVRFYDTIFGKLERYMKYACDICAVFRNHLPISGCLNSAGEHWLHNDESNSSEMVHFYRQECGPSREELEDQLGILCSAAVRYPEALRLKLLTFEEKRIRVWVLRFDKNKQVGRILDFEIDQLEKIENDEERKKLIVEKTLQTLDAVFALEARYSVSTLPAEIHEVLRSFIKNNPSLRWEVTQPGPGVISAAGVFQSREKESGEIKEFSRIRFYIQTEYHAGSKTLDFSQYITSDFPGADEKALSEITGFKLLRKKNEDPAKLSAFLDESGRELSEVHNEVYKIYKEFFELDKLLSRWLPYKAAAELLLDSRSSCINAFKDNEICWEYYLSPETRMCRRLREKEYPVMFSIRFSAPGARSASVGWCGEHSFNYLTPREKELFWRYVLSQFPQELEKRFCCRKNAVFLEEVFESTEKLKPLLEEWTAPREGGSLIEQMFKEIDKAVKTFGVQKSH